MVEIVKTLDLIVSYPKLQLEGLYPCCLLLYKAFPLLLSRQTFSERSRRKKCMYRLLVVNKACRHLLKDFNEKI